MLKKLIVSTLVATSALTAVACGDSFNRTEAEADLKEAVKAYCTNAEKCDSGDKVDTCVKYNNKIVNNAGDECAEEFFDTYTFYYDYQAKDKNLCEHMYKEDAEIDNLLKPYYKKLYDCYTTVGKKKFGSDYANIEKLCKMEEFSDDDSYDDCMMSLSAYSVSMPLCEKEIITYYSTLAKCAVERNVSDCHEDETVENTEDKFDECIDKYYD